MEQHRQSEEEKIKAKQEKNINLFSESLNI